MRKAELRPRLVSDWPIAAAAALAEVTPGTIAVADARRLQRLDLLVEPPEDRRVAALQPHHRRAAAARACTISALMSACFHDGP